MKEKVVIKKKVQTVMRDGTKLSADLYLPGTKGPFPTIVERVPIFKERDITSYMFDFLVKKGFAIISQDSASRWHKEGVIRPFFSTDWTDAEDGYDTIEWVAMQPWCNGKVGSFGYSYSSWTAWVLATQKPPHLAALFCGGMVPKSTDWQMGGVFRIGRQLQKTLGPMATYNQKKFKKPFGPSNIEEYQYQEDCTNKNKWLWYLPIKELPLEMIGDLKKRFHDWLDNINIDRWNLDEYFEKIDLPVFHFTSWYDRLSRTVHMFKGMREKGASEETRRNQRMIIGPWSHMDWAKGKTIKNSNIAILSGKVGQVDFGNEAQIDLPRIVCQWFEYWLMEKKNNIMNKPPVQLFIMGANSWRGENSWPIKRSVLTDFYLHSKGYANTPFGDGWLNNNTPGNEPPDKYFYDPRDPVMTLYNANYQDEPHDQRVLDHRRDILVYQTEVLRNPIEVTGEPLLILYASSSVPDTDFTVKLIDVWPNGFSQDLCYGIVRTRFRDGFQEPKMMKKGEIYELKIRLLPTSNLFKVGHKIRVDISSSDFPNFDRNHNTGGDDYGESNLVIARQTVYHETNYQTRIQLPLIP